jgi:branched-chain amino acid transport system permease protein
VDEAGYVPGGRRYLKASVVGLGGFGLLIALFPLVSPDAYTLHLAAATLIWAGLAVTWNLFSGYTGYLSVGHAAFFGIGAYASLLTVPRLGFIGALCVGAAAAGVIGLLVGTATLRLRGLYFALVTLGLTASLRTLTLMLGPVTGGAAGVTLDRFPPLLFVYGLAGGGVVLLLALALVLMSRPVGLRLIAIGDDEEALAATGVHVDRYKILAFTLTVMGAAVFGGLYSYRIGFINPDSVFAVAISFQVVIMVALGGRGTVWGPVIGALGLSAVSELLWIRFPFLNDLFLGLTLIVVVMVAPRGLFGYVKRRIGAEASHHL